MIRPPTIDTLQSVHLVQELMDTDLHRIIRSQVRSPQIFFKRMWKVCVEVDPGTCSVLYVPNFERASIPAFGQHSSSGFKGKRLFQSIIKFKDFWKSFYEAIQLACECRLSTKNRRFWPSSYLSIIRFLFGVPVTAKSKVCKSFTPKKWQHAVFSWSKWIWLPSSVDRIRCNTLVPSARNLVIWNWIFEAKFVPFWFRNAWNNLN